MCGSKYLVLSMGQVVESAHSLTAARSIAEARTVDTGVMHALVCVIAEYDVAKPRVCITNYPVPMWTRNGCVHEGDN